MSEYVPLFVDMIGRHVTVFGGGQVALRKCNHFRDSNITIIAEKILPEFEGIVKKTVVCRIDEVEISSFLHDSDIVIAATDDKELNDTIVKKSKNLGVPVNSAHGGGDILIPSVLERKGYIVAVSSKGKVPAFPPYVVEELDKLLDDKFDTMLDMMIALRSKYSNMWDQKRRSQFYYAVLRDDEVFDHICNDDIEAALERAERIGELS